MTSEKEDRKRMKALLLGLHYGELEAAEQLTSLLSSDEALVHNYRTEDVYFKLAKEIRHE